MAVPLSGGALRVQVPSLPAVAGWPRARQARGSMAAMSGRRVGVLVALAVAAGVGGVGWWWLSAADVAATPEARLARELAGERWYSVRLRHRPVGHYYTVAERSAGVYRFRSELEFALADGAATRMEDELLFDAEPPHGLVRASHARLWDGVPKMSVVIADGVAAIEERGGKREVAAEFRFDLARYLALERWLQVAPRRVGETNAVQSLDFDRLALKRTVWRVVDATGGEGDVSGKPREVVVARDGMLDETRIRLGADLAPLTLALPPLFTIDRVADRGRGLAWRDAQMVGAAPFAAGWWLLPVQPPIERPDDLTRLVLDAGEAPAWPGDSVQAEGRTLLLSDAGRVRPASVREQQAATAATLTFPADAPAVRSLTERATKGLGDARQLANALTWFVHNHLSYREHASLRTVHDTLRDRVGDCSEFADVLTSMARAAGLPARTVVGIAYSAEQQGFAPHAWNEIAVDGHWHAFDPTWGQIRADATHLAIPDEDFARTLADWADVHLRIVDASRCEEDCGPAG